jgi:hypothetical protein
MPCYREVLPATDRSEPGVAFICGDLGPHCSAGCGASSSLLCDFPVGEGKTCDAPLCWQHGTEVAPDIHYCTGHMALFEQFKNSDEMKAILRNVVFFQKPKPKTE